MFCSARHTPSLSDTAPVAPTQEFDAVGCNPPDQTKALSSLVWRAPTPRTPPPGVPTPITATRPHGGRPYNSHAAFNALLVGLGEPRPVRIDSRADSLDQVVLDADTLEYLKENQLVLIPPNKPPRPPPRAGEVMDRLEERIRRRIEGTDPHRIWRTLAERLEETASRQARRRRSFRGVSPAADGSGS